MVIMDLSMPDMTGIDAIAGILRFNPEANIIVLSGSNFSGNPARGVRTGRENVYCQTFNFDRVIGAIQSILV